MKDPEEFNPGYYQTCLMAVVACVAGILERDEPFTEQDREYLRVHVNSVLHESRKLRRAEQQAAFRKKALHWYQKPSLTPLEVYDRQRDRLGVSLLTNIADDWE